MSRKLTVREKVYGYVKRKYGSEPEYLWRRFPDYAIFRHEDNRKWYGLIMDISAENLGLPGEDRVDILNVKLDDLPWKLDLDPAGRNGSYERDP